MSHKPELKLDWCSHAAAKYACEHWHYSGCMPAGKIVKIGVWEAGQYTGCVLFSRGASAAIGKPYGLAQMKVCELTRVALTRHITPVSRLIAIALKLLVCRSGGLRLVVSYADPDRGHNGGVYQAGNWLYAGKSAAQREVVVNGVEMHKRSAVSRFGTVKGLQYGPIRWKHKYLMPLDDDMRRQIEPLRKPYPKKASEAGDGGVHPHSGGAAPTRTLQPTEAD